MKNSLKATAIAIALVSSFTASAAGYGVVDTNKVMQQLPQREAVSKKLSEEFQPRIVELKKLKAELNTLAQKRQRDAALMTQQEQIQLGRQLELLEVRFKLKDKAFKEDQQRRNQEEQNKLVLLLQRAIKAVSVREKLDLVVTKQVVLFVQPELDISDKVIQELSK